MEKSRDASGFDELSQHIASAALAWIRRGDTGKVLENGGAAELTKRLAAVALPSPVNRTSVRAEDDKPCVILLPLRQFSSRQIRVEMPRFPRFANRDSLGQCPPKRVDSSTLLSYFKKG